MQQAINSVASGQVLYGSVACALYAAFGQPQALYAQAVAFGSSDGTQRKRADAMSKMDWIAQHGMVRQAIERELKKEDYWILLLRYGCTELESQRAGARLELAGKIKEQMPQCALQFLFYHATVSWCGKVPRDDLAAWAEKLDVPYRTLARHRVQAKAIMDQWLDQAWQSAYRLLIDRRWIESHDE